MHIDLTSASGAVHGLLAATSTTTKPAGGGSSFFLILIVLALGAYLWMRPQRKRMRAQQEAQKNIQVGDAVVTAAGIVGRVKDMHDDRVEIEIAPGTTIEIVRRALGTRLDEPAAGSGMPSSHLEAPVETEPATNGTAPGTPPVGGYGAEGDESGPAATGSTP